jgi:hypothetical protein
MRVAQSDIIEDFCWVPAEDIQKIWVARSLGDRE